MGDPEQYRETTYEGRECYVEYALSIITGHNKHGFGNHATEEAITQFNELISDIFTGVMQYYATEFTEKQRDCLEEELRYLSILRYLFIRGASYPEYHLDLIKDLFKPHDEFFKQHYGIITENVIDGIFEIERQVETTFNNFIKNFKVLHELFKKFIDENQEISNLTPEEILQKFHTLPNVQENQQHFKEFFDRIPFEVTLNSVISKDLINLLSIEIGENRKFFSFTKAFGWPTNESIIYTKPLLKHNGKIYSFLPQLLFRNLEYILEEWIKQKAKKYFDRSYQKKRADYLEEMALKYFAKLLPNANIYNKVYYKMDVDGKKESFETDGIILYDKKLFILEMKAGRLSLPARRGGIKRIKRDVGELINSAYSQALRTKKYIEITDKPCFEYEDTSVALIIQDKYKIENIFLINVTLEYLGELSTCLNSLKHLKFIEGQEWIWSVFINDLRVISEILDSPSEFLLFLKRRLRVNDFPQYKVTDELDFLMLYLKEGLYLEEAHKNKDTSFLFHGYTEPLDRYFDFLAGRVSSGEKPVFKTHPEFKELIKNIELLGKEGFSEVTTTLLDLDVESHKKIIKNLHQIKNLLINDGKEHNVTLYFKDDCLGISFFIGIKHNIRALEEVKDFCKIKMYQTKCKDWIAIVIDDISEITSPFDFCTFHEEFKYDSQLEQKVRLLKKWNWKQSGLENKKIGRNTKCPCNSGLKYKKCCGK